MTAVASRKQKASNQGLHRQAVVGQTVRANVQQGPDTSQPLVVQAPQGTVLSANGQGAKGSPSTGKATQGTDGSKGNAFGPDGAEIERTSSGRMLNPFASTFIPHSSSSSMLSTTSQ